MIEWLLRRLEMDPTEAFSERELRQCDADAFDELRRGRFLRRDAIPAGPVHRVVDGRSVIYVQTPDGDRVGLDLDDPESDPLDFADAASWRLHLPTLLEALRQLHDLLGKSEQFDDRLHLVGERATEHQTLEGWVLAFLRPGSESVTRLASLPTLTGGRYGSFRVLCPSFQLAPNDAALLRDASISVGPLDSPSKPSTPASAEWSHSILYDSITWDGRTRKLTKSEAAVVRALDEARSKHPVLSLRELADAADRPSVRRLQDLFSRRNRDLIGTLIADDGRGRYRLNITRPPN
jgi:hypothetical protein